MDVSDPFQGLSADFVHLDDAADRPLGSRQILLVPGSDVAVLPLDLPTGLRGQNREQVARRQLQDQIGLDPDIAEMRPLQTKSSGAGWSRVLVADRAAIKAWASKAGTSCRAVLPDYLALPTAPALWSMAPTARGFAARLGPDDGFGASEATAVALLERALQEADPAPKALLQLGPLPATIAALFAARDIPVITDMRAAKGLGLPKLQVLEHGEVQMDLRRDPQMARTALARRVLPWRWPLLLGIIAAGLWGASQQIVVGKIKEETAKVTQSTTALVQEHFVATGPVLDARVQVSQAIAKLQGEVAGPVTRADPMLIFNRAASVVAQQGAVPRNVIYTGDETLTMILQVADFAAAEQLARALSEAALEVTVIDTRVSEGGDTVRTELRLTPRPEPDQ